MNTPRLPSLGGHVSTFNVSPRDGEPHVQRQRRGSRNSASKDSSPRSCNATHASASSSQRKDKDTRSVTFEPVDSQPTCASPVDEPTGNEDANHDGSDHQHLQSPPNLKVIKALAKVFDARLGTRPIESRGVGMFVTWNDLYNHMDSDSSGHVDYADFEWMVRKELGVRPSSLPDSTLHGLFTALGHDGSSISLGAFGHFMRYYAQRARPTLP